jgi:hypothetical protein
MPHGGTLDIPTARNAEEAERIVGEALSKDPRIHVANPVTLIEMESEYDLKDIFNGEKS